MSADKESLTFLGLTDSGKTHFLVALDVVLTKGKIKSEDRLEHHSTAADRSYLQPLRQKWMKGEDFGRTKRNDPPPPQELVTIHKPSGKVIALTLPDMPGEEFDAQFTTRTLSESFEEQVKESTGFLLFVHCEQDAAHAILENHPEFLAFLGVEEGNEVPPAPSEQQVKDAVDGWELDWASRQAKIVDLLQFLIAVRGDQVPVKIAVMISAWDVVEKMAGSGPATVAEFPLEPAEFLKKRWALLSQFLSARDDLFEFEVFGVSARGGGTSVEEIKRLTETIPKPEDRVLMVRGDSRSNDLTLPIRWLVGLAG